MEQVNNLQRPIKSIIPKKHISFSLVNERLKAEVTGIIRLMADKRSIPALIALLDDEEFDVRWIAAESLIRIGRSSIIPLLSTLKDGKGHQFPGKAHHVLQCLLTRREKRELHDLLSCLATRGCIEKATAEASAVLQRVYGVN